MPHNPALPPGPGPLRPPAAFSGQDVYKRQVVDRSKGTSPLPVVASALQLDLPNWAPEECPVCAEGKLPLVKPGSRKMALK